MAFLDGYQQVKLVAAAKRDPEFEVAQLGQRAWKWIYTQVEKTVAETVTQFMEDVRPAVLCGIAPIGRIDAGAERGGKSRYFLTPTCPHRLRNRQSCWRQLRRVTT
jgi:hypothetical protein